MSIIEPRKGWRHGGGIVLLEKEAWKKYLGFFSSHPMTSHSFLSLVLPTTGNLGKAVH